MAKLYRFDDIQIDIRNIRILKADKVLSAKPANDLIWDIWSVSRTTRVEKQLTHYSKTNAFVRYPNMSSRGNQIVYEYAETTGTIWLLEFK